MDYPDVLMNLTEMMHHLGSLMEIDDFKDYGRFSFKGHPSMIHHWWIGALMREFSEMLGTGIATWQALLELEQEDKKELMESFNFTKHNDLLSLGRSIRKR